jgi:hypothetical protein
VSGTLAIIALGIPTVLIVSAFAAFASIADEDAGAFDLGKPRDDTRHQGTDGGASPSECSSFHETTNSAGRR